MKKRYPLLKAVPAEYHVVADQSSFNYAIQFKGPGWYSLDGSKVLRPGKYPTSCRVHIVKRGEEDKESLLFQAMIRSKERANRQQVRYERLLRRLRQRIFQYEDEGGFEGKKAIQCTRLIQKAKARCLPRWEEEYKARAADRQEKALRAYTM